MSKVKKIFKAVGKILGGDEPKTPAIVTPPVVTQDPKADQAKADEESAKKANAARIATKRAKAGGTSLLASGSMGVEGEATTSSVLATGKAKLGQ